MAKQKRRIYCKFCDYFCYEADDFVSHLEKHHDEMIPEDMSPWQFSYYLRTGKTHGNCVICKGKTSWNEKTHKYNRLCEKPKCKETYINIFKNRMIGKYGKTTLLNDPEQQKKMLANRQISGEYTWRDHVHKTTYTGSYEKSFLEFLDVIMNFDPNDIIAPSPHTYWYMYEGRKHFYIPDFFIPSLELEIEIKDGGDNPNMHSKIQNVDKVKEKLKDDVMMNNQFNYIKIVNKDNTALFKFLELAKEREFDRVQKPIFIIESEEDFSDGEVVTESDGELFEELHWDTLLTRPEIYRNKNVKMYHYANTKKDVVKPITVNAGNKLAKPRFSSWWTPQRSQSAWALSNVLFSKFKDKKWKDITWTIESVTDNGITYKAPITVIGESFFNENENLIKSIDVYEHEKTFNGKDLGRGNEYSVDEFTCDFPVKPDKVRRVEWEDISKFVKIVPDEELTKYAKDINDMRLRNKNFQDLVHEKKPWLYWNFEVSNDIREKYCKEHDIDFKVDEEYYRFTYNGVGIYEALRQNVNLDTWKKLLKSPNFTWLPKPENYPKTCISYFTREGRDMFLKKVLPICEKYLGNDIEFSKVKNIKHIVYKDKYQIIVDTSLVTESEELCEYESVFMESIHKSTLSKNFKKKDNKDINNSVLDIHSNEAKEYIDNDSYLSSLKPKLKDFTGEIIVDNDKNKIIGRVLIGTGKDAGFIGAIRVNDEYKGYGFGAQLIDDAVKKYNGIDLIVLKDNEVALNLYKKHGFVIVDIKGIGKNEYYMKLKSKVNKNDKIITESIDDKNIDTVIFDLGSVLVKNTFRENIINSNIPDEDYEYLIFKYAEMSQHITETMSTDEAIELFKTSLKPEFTKYAKEIFTVLNTGIKPFEFTESMIKNLKDKGYKVYYLSNWNRASFELCKEKGLFDFLKLFDGGIVSYEVDMMKPEKTIYNLLIDKFSINPAKAIFFDDRKENVDAAISVGLHAEVFDVKKHTEYDIFSLKDIYEAVNTITMDDIKSFNKELNSWDYGVLINGKKYTKSSEIDWSQYKTIPIKDIEKHHVGICWDFVNYQHNWFRGAGIKDESYLFVMQLSDNPDDIVTHTFSIITFEGKKYWFESSWFGHQGVREIRSYKDVIDELIAKYDKGNNHSYSVFKYSPDGMDRNITNGDFFNKATRSLVYDHKGKEKE